MEPAQGHRDSAHPATLINPTTQPGRDDPDCRPPLSAAASARGHGRLISPHTKNDSSRRDQQCPGLGLAAAGSGDPLTPAQSPLVASCDDPCACQAVAGKNPPRASPSGSSRTGTGDDGDNTTGAGRATPVLPHRSMPSAPTITAQIPHRSPSAATRDCSSTPFSSEQAPARPLPETETATASATVHTCRMAALTGDKRRIATGIETAGTLPGAPAAPRPNPRSPTLSPAPQNAQRTGTRRPPSPSPPLPPPSLSVSAPSVTKPSTPGRFAFFSMPGLSRLTHSASAAAPATSLSSTPTGHDLLDIDVDAALFPNPASRDASSPAAFKNLATRALALLTAFQDAHRRQAAELSVLRAERDATADEREGAETRVLSLRAMLDGTTRRAAEHEAAAARLADELAVAMAAAAESERLRVEAEQEAKRLGRHNQGQQQPRDQGDDDDDNDDNDGGGGEGTDTDVATEDLCVDEEDGRRRRRRRRMRHRRYWRKSVAPSTATTISIDTDDDDDDDDGESAEVASIFSHSRSPTVVSGVFEGAPSPATTAPPSRVASLVPPKASPDAAGTGTAAARSASALSPTSSPRQPQQPQMTTFQKLLKGISGGDGHNSSGNMGGGGPGSCDNCRGQTAGVAWDTVGLLRDENTGLKKRVDDLETAVEGVLDLVNGVGAGR